MSTTTTERRPVSWRGPRPAHTAAAVLAAFLAAFVLLSWQLSAGRDPALGAGSPAPAPQQQRQVVHRIVKRTVVTRVVDAPAPDSGTAGMATPSGAGAVAPATPVSAPAPQRSAPAPRRSAPAPAPAPAPSPAPVTRTS